MAVTVDGHKKPDIRGYGAKEDNPTAGIDWSVIPAFVFEELHNEIALTQITLRYKVKLFFFPAKYFFKIFQERESGLNLPPLELHIRE